MNKLQAQVLQNALPEQKGVLTTLDNNASKVALGAALFLPFAANAAIDVSEITTLIGEAVVAAGVIGLAFLGFKAGIAVIKSLRSAA